MISYKINNNDEYAQEFDGGVPTGRWLNTLNNAEFKKAVMDGAELQDADGVVMTPEAAKAFIQTLP